MKKFIYTFIIISIVFSACEKDPVEELAQPTAIINIGGQIGGFVIAYTDSAFTIGTHDALVLINQSKNADSISWNFGNGKTSSANNNLLSYDSAGSYTITLTAINKNGVKSITTKRVIAMERVVKGFTIDNLQLNRFRIAPVALPTFSKADVWIEIKYADNWSDPLAANGDLTALVIYKSPVFSSIDSSFHSSLNFSLPISNKVIINSPVNNNDYSLKGRGTIINLYVKDNSGTYLLNSSLWSGLQVSNGGNPARSKTYGLGIYAAVNTINLDCFYQ